ncbi:MAG: hypothetical protein ACI9KE_003518 [Polyangiales bacterium]
MYDGLVTPYEEMREDERTAFAGLVRLMTRMDGVLSSEEVAAVSALAREIEAPNLWSLMNETSLLERAELVLLIDDIRPEMRSWIHGVLTRIAQADGIDEAELELLSWLEGRWNLASLA